MTTGVSRRINTDRQIFGTDDGRDDVSLDFDRTLAVKEAEDVVFFFLHWHEFRHRLAALGDDDGLALGGNFVHDSQTVDFELTRSHGFHRKPSFDHGHYAMVMQRI